MDAASLFSADYGTSRERFRDAVARLGWQLESHRLDMTGPRGEDLTLDVALSPGEPASPALVLSSGLHGIEGFLGSALQLGLLERGSHAPSSATPSATPLRYVLPHGLNPFGFAWLRRVNEDNVDLNRNFLLDGEAYRGSPPKYAALDDLLNPRRPPAACEFTLVRELATIARHGAPALKQAIAAGQCDFPQGLFYGGTGPSWTHRILAQHLARWLRDARLVAHLDFHSGLGAWKSGKLLIDYPLTERQQGWLEGWFGADAYERSHARGVSYQTRGGMGAWLVARQPEREYLYACAELGTYSPFKVLRGLQAENRAHHWGRPEDPASRRSKQRLRELFCPASPDWRRRAIELSLNWVDQAIAGLRAARP